MVRITTGSILKLIEIIFTILSQKVVQLDGPPDGIGSEEVDDLLLRHGIEVEIPGIPGSPVVLSGDVLDHLTENKFDITFVGINGKEVKSEVKIARKIWFAGTVSEMLGVDQVTTHV